MKRHVVLDTNVISSALRSRRGASFALLRQLGTGSYQAHLTVPLFLEYQEQVHRLVDAGVMRKDAADDILDYICAVATQDPVHFLWRPFLRDADDDMVLEAAVAGQCTHIITHNLRDFRCIGEFGVAPLTPNQFLNQLRGQP